MSIPTVANSVRANLPYLRRYARSLTGKQSSGDAYVGMVLEALVSEPSSFQHDVDPRVALYRAFAKMWNSVGANLRWGPVPANSGSTLVDSRIEALMPIPRQAFLLAAVENFTPDEVAIILDRSPAQIERDLDEAGREIAAQVATDVLIIEDEPLIAMDLESVVTSIGHTVIGMVRTKTEAIAAVARKPPGLILADVRLADGSSGLDAVREILGSISVPVIFITAFPEEVLTGLRPEPTFLISKPFKEQTIKTIVSQALFFDIKAENDARAAS